MFSQWYVMILVSPVGPWGRTKAGPQSTDDPNIEMPGDGVR
jgi:hypothetical protein